LTGLSPSGEQAAQPSRAWRRDLGNAFVTVGANADREEDMPHLIPSAAIGRLAGGALLTLAVGGSTLAWAQTPAANIPAYGPPLTGVCLFSRDIALNSSQAGVSVGQQLQQISQGIQTNLNPQRDAIAKEDTTLNAQKAKLPAAQYAQRVNELQQRAQAFTQTVQTRNAQITQTHDKAMDQIAAAINPILIASISAHHCSLVLERNGIYGANPAMDLTAEVVQKLNASLPTVAVTLAPPEAVQAQP
jgi:Skp family chaperone for outer membrane proteins